MHGLLMTQKAKELSGVRFLLFSTLTLALTGLTILSAGEIFVRIVVPKETFWPVSNIYASSEVPNLVYTYRPEFWGTAFGVGLETNSLGFRGPEWSREKASGTLRIALIGDSYAFGYGVPFSLSVGEVLADILVQRTRIPTEVMNFGVNGYNATQQQAVLQHIALDFFPDLIVLMPTNNDHEPNLRADEAGWLHWDSKPENESSRIVDRSIGKSQATKAPFWLSRSRLLLYLKLMQKRYRLEEQPDVELTLSPEPGGSYWMGEFPPGPVPPDLVEPIYEPYRMMLEMAKDQGIPLVIASNWTWTTYRQLLQNVKNRFNVPAIELIKLLPEARNHAELNAQFSLGWDGHLNVTAHRRFAEGIADLIEAHGYAVTASH